MNKVLSILVYITTLPLLAQNSLPAKKVTIFKNSTALMLREGTASAKNNQITLPIPSQTIFGSYFIGASKDNSIKSILFKNDTLKKPEQCASIWQYLAGNINKPVALSYIPTQGIEKTVSGKVTDYDLHSGMLRFTTDAGKTMVMHVGNIYAVDFKEAINNTYVADSIKRMMVIKLDKPASEVQLQELYMTNGINWLPSYFLKLKDEKNARLEMKATVENYAEEINNAEVELVVGSPQMSYSQLDPMTYDYLTTSVNDGAGGGYAAKNYMQNNGIVFEAAPDADGFFDQNFTTEGEKTGDMYIYKLGKISVPQNSKGSFPIFAGNIEYKDKYEGSISDITNYYSNRFVPQEEQKFDVYHSLEIKNTSTVPLTTASVMVINEKDQLVAQDELKYTPAGATGNIRLSKAIDIHMKNTEEEINRTDNAKKIGKITYSKVVLKGSILLDNYQSKDVVVSVKKSLNGTVTEVTNNGKAAKLNAYNYTNPSSEIKWEVKIPAGQKATLNYSYEVLFQP